MMDVHTERIWIALSSALLVATIAGAWNAVAPNLREWRAERVSGPALDGITYGKGPTLVMVLRSDCRYCIESARFYSRLTHLKKSQRATGRIVAAFPVADQSALKFLFERSIVPDQVVRYEKGQLIVQGTPTLLLVDETGELKRTWVGKLSAGEEADLINSLRLEAD
jgi:hypothetical protein